MRSLSIAITAIAFLTCCQPLSAQSHATDWAAVKGVITEKEFLGRKALHLTRGPAYLPGSEFRNGVIEVDIAGAVMAGIIFRMDADHNYEEAYIRLPKSGGLDALQYGPVFNGEFSWQFYPEYQAAVVYPQNAWVHLKIVVENDKAAVYVLNQDTAVMYIDSLRGNHSAGKVGVWSLSTGAYFSNYSFRELTAADRLPAIPLKSIYNTDAIHEWQISEPAVFTAAPPEQLGADAISAHQWKTGASEPDGYLNINRFARKQTWGMGFQNSTDLVWLRYEWNEPAEGLKPLSFEFGNKAFIYLNRQKLFAGQNSFLLKTSFYRGDMDKKMRANTIFLPVKKGKNELLVAVASTGNGWGFVAQFADTSTRK
jgi:hypothetical protein